MWCMPRKCKKEAKLLLSLSSTIDHLNDYQFLDLKLQFPETLHYYEINLSIELVQKNLLVEFLYLVSLIF